MATHYTDVDELIFDRWNEVKALQDAFEDLLGRMQDVVDGVLQKVSVRIADKGFATDTDIKKPSIRFWKPEWATKRGEAGVYLSIADFVPSEYGKDVEEHPWTWVMTEDFSRLRTKESSEDFGRVLRAAGAAKLGTKWDSEGADLSATPLGRHCIEISEADRVRLAGDPKALYAYLLERVEEAIELVPVIDEALQKMTRR